MYIVIDKDIETWKNLKAYNIVDGYEISNYGNIRKSNSGKELDISVSSDGYKRVKLKTYSGKKYTFLVHRLVAFTFVDGYDITTGKIIVNHIDSIRSHSYYENLEWVTCAENIKHGYDHGRIIKYGIPKIIPRTFDDDTVDNICRYLEMGHSPSKIYDLLNTTKYSKKSISDFIHRLKTEDIIIYQHITSKYNIPNVNPQNELDSDLVETICELLSLGYYTEEIIQILNIPKDNHKKYQKNISDIKNRRTFRPISSKYIFPVHIYGRKPKYSINATIEICKMIRDNITTPKITEYICSKYIILDKIKLRDYIYDIKRKRLHTNILAIYD